jgi:hypothetical protein
MSAFATPEHAALWRKRWCDRCYQPDEFKRRFAGEGQGCPIFKAAEDWGVPAPEWSAHRSPTIEGQYRCKAFVAKPSKRRQAAQPAPSLPMFDEPEHADRRLVPVEGWPDYHAQGIRR